MISLHSQLFLLTLWTPISNDATELVVHQKFSFRLVASKASKWYQRFFRDFSFKITNVIVCNLDSFDCISQNLDNQ